MSTPTPEQFLLGPSDLEDEDTAFGQDPAVAGWMEAFRASPNQLWQLPPNPLESIAASLDRLVALVEKQDADEAEDDGRRALVDQLDRELSEKQALIEKVLEICKPSTSKLANAIRAELQPPVQAPEPQTEPRESAMPLEEGDPGGPIEVELPAPDAPVEVWREYAATVVDPGGPDIDRMNRSQIRTLLGIPQPVEVSS